MAVACARRVAKAQIARLGRDAAYCLIGVALALGAWAEDTNVTQPVADIEARLQRTPLAVLDMEQARPAIAEDRTVRLSLAPEEGEAPLRAKWKPVHAGGQGFNNEPRYELAAYRLQQLFLDEDEYVVPPVVLRSESPQDHEALLSDTEPTFRGTSSVLVLLSYWVENVTNRDPFRPERFETDPLYARYWGNVNLLTHLIDHKDGNVGNLLISLDADSPRVFSVDNDVAFRSNESDLGNPWSRLHVRRLPERALERLRALTLEDLEAALGVVAEFAIVGGRLVATEPGRNLNPRLGVRNADDRIQLGLTSAEISDVYRRVQRLLRSVDRGRIGTF